MSRQENELLEPLDPEQSRMFQELANFSRGKSQPLSYLY